MDDNASNRQSWIDDAIARWRNFTPTMRAMAIQKIPHEHCSAKPRCKGCEALDAARNLLIQIGDLQKG